MNDIKMNDNKMNDNIIYNRVNTNNNDIELCNNIVYDPLNDQINEVDMTNNINISDCCICLNPNDTTSIQLDCGCNNKFHFNCVKEIKKNNTSKCPICRKNILADVKNNDVLLCVNCVIRFILVLFILILLFTTYIGFIFIFRLIVHPSEFKYCDNHIKPCDYHKTVGTLYSNKIITKYDNFMVHYKLESSYNYNIGKLNYNCTNTQYKTYSSYDEIVVVSEKSLNSKNEIYYNIKNKNICKSKYKWYNPSYFNLNVLSITMICLLFITRYFIKYHIVIRQQYNSWIYDYGITLFGVLTMAALLINILMIFIYYILLNE